MPKRGTLVFTDFIIAARSYGIGVSRGISEGSVHIAAQTDHFPDGRVRKNCGARRSVGAREAGTCARANTVSFPDDRTI
jgi:hypothetical protein